MPEDGQTILALQARRENRRRGYGCCLQSLRHKASPSCRPEVPPRRSLEESGGIHFLVMELVEGVTLEDYIAGNAGVPAGKKAAETVALPVEDALALCRQIAE